MIARAAYRCKKPLISAIGHEIDYTILDFVADRRAPTPSAAAELAVPDREEQKRILLDLQQNIRKNMQNRLDLCYNGLEQYNFVLEQGDVYKRQREDQAMMTTLAGLVVVLSILVKQISVLFVTIKSLFAL